MSGSQDNYPTIQKRMEQIRIGENISNSSTILDETDSTIEPHSSPTKDTPDAKTKSVSGQVKGSLKRQGSRKLLRHVSFCGELPEDVKHTLESRGRMGSISGDIDESTSTVVRRVDVLLLYTGGALGWKLVPGGKRGELVIIYKALVYNLGTL